MSTKKEMLSFLHDLSENNSKEWMDENRSRYLEAKNCWIDEVTTILNRLDQYNPGLAFVKPKNTFSRINNNRRFHPDKPIYKDFFSCEISGKNEGLSLFYIAVGSSWSFVGGGLHNPSSPQLKAFRETVDYEGKVLEEILADQKFVDFYGGLTHFRDVLKSAPRGYSTDHLYIKYLRYKSITATRDLMDHEIIGDHFIDLVEEAYVAFKPLEEFLIRATGVVI